MPRFPLASNSTLTHAVILLAISLPYCIHLGTPSIWDSNEAFYAETPREMMISGDYISPMFNYQIRTQKPPLTYWAILFSYKLFGVNELAVRLPGMLAAIGVLLFSYGSARLFFNPRAGLIAAVIAATTPRIFILARRLPVDILLLFFLTGTMFFILRAIQKKEKRSWALAYTFASLGFLTKGPIAVIIPAGACLGWMLWNRRLRISEAHPLIGLAVFALIVLPWYVLIYMAHGWTYISTFFLSDNLGRFAAQSMGPSRGIFFYFSVFATDFFPWSFLILFAIYVLSVARREMQPLKTLAYGFPLIWCAFTFLLFSLSKNKQEYYIAPIFPAAALIISGIVDAGIRKIGPQKLLETDRDSRFIGRAPASDGVLMQKTPLWALSYGLIALLLLLVSLFIPYILSMFLPDISIMLHYASSLILIAGSVLLMWSLARRKPLHCFLALSIPIWTVYMIGALFYVPALESFRPVKRFCLFIEGQSHENEEAGYFRTALPSMAFYLRRPIFQESNYERMTGKFESGRRIFCILAAKDYAYFRNKGIPIHILDRHSRFSVRLGNLWNAGYFPGEELLLVSNQPYSETKAGKIHGAS
jgi:4-amino-4-deoxy-L-arabinose transferase-like glycosyltransferase